MTSPISSHRFQAMASPCEILFDGLSDADAARLGALAETETRRIEQKFSRYRPDNLIDRINHANGHPVTVDEETARLLDFADRLHQLSGGLFDITSGALRRIWTFDGSDRVPEPEAIAAVLPFIGWHRVRWQPPELQLPSGMEIDLGGIGKEYAVDQVFALLAARTDAPLLVNFGGDLRCRGPRRDGSPWQVGIEHPGRDGQALRVLALTDGGVATSGDARRFLLRNGVRYGHILNPLTGMPVADAPRSVTVVAATCTEAGMLSTLAMLCGAGAEAFLEEQQVRHWVVREPGE